MKLFRQLIIFGLIVAMLWYDSGPVIGPDGRIECCSADFQAINMLDYLQPTDTFPARVDIIEVAYGNSGLALTDLPIIRKFRSEPSRFWQAAITYVPLLRQIPRIKSKAQDGWILYFTVTPQQLEQLNKVRDDESALLMFQ
jgi:hypothetical protein